MGLLLDKDTKEDIHNFVELLEWLKVFLQTHEIIIKIEKKGKQDA